MNDKQKEQLKKVKGLLKNKRLIFTVTPGRSGTGYLAKILNLLPNVRATHEPNPLFSTAYQRVRKYPNLAYDFWLNTKLPAIAKFSESTYVETSHLFCKGFVEPLMEFGLNVGLISLKRDNSLVAQSMYELGDIPGRSLNGSYWYVVPGEKIALTTIPGWTKMHDYQLCFWYTIEIDERTDKIWKTPYYKCEKIVLHVDYGDIRLKPQFKGFLDLFGLEYNSKFWAKWEKVKDQRINIKKHRKTSRPLIDSLRKRLEEEVRKGYCYKEKVY